VFLMARRLQLLIRSQAAAEGGMAR
jgi:hypothetical protein